MERVLGTPRYSDTRVLRMHAAVQKYQDLGTSRILPFELHAFMFALFNMSVLYENRDRIEFPIASRIHEADRKIEEGLKC